MARSIDTIFKDKLARVAADATLGALLTSTSKFSVFRLILYISAVCDFTLENLFDIHKQDVNDTIAAMKPHSLQWYAGKAKAFQYGDNLAFGLAFDADYYDNTGIADSVVEASKIVTYAAVVEQQSNNIRLRLKVATTSGSDLAALSGPQLAAFTTYMQDIKDAGVKLSITSTAADSLKLGLRIKYNALVLNANGGRIDGVSATPVPDAIRTFLTNLPFNGVFSVASLEDAVQKVEGVNDVKIDLVQTKYGALPFTSVDIDYIPDSGYLRIIDADLNLTFIPA